MGALFPSMHETNPSKIVSGFGGTLTLILSISLVVTTVSSEALVCHHFLEQPADDFKITMLAMLGATAIVCSLAAYIPLRLGARELERMEF